MSGARERGAGTGAADARRRRVWKAVVAASALSLVAAIAGCLFMLGTRGVQADVARMRDEVGETLTMMSLGGADEAAARHLPRLVDAAARWRRAFAAQRARFRGLDAEIDQAQALERLGEAAARWRRELEGAAPARRDALWRRSLKPQIADEQKRWPNRLRRKGAAGWAREAWAEFLFGAKHGSTWPVGLCERTAELARGGCAVDRLGVGDRLRYVFFPYRLSAFTMLRLAGIACATTAIGYLLCWIGMRARFGALSYAGLLSFLYLVLVSLFIILLEVTK